MAVTWKRWVPLGAVLAPLPLLSLLWLGGERREPPARSAPRVVAARAAESSAPAVVTEPAPESDRVEQVVLSQKKRIMGRKKSLLYVRRVVEEIGPLVARGLEQPQVQADLQALAAEQGQSLAEYKRYFQRKQEADLLLESGGDPNARSVSNAIGVAQWLASTGRYQGLRIDAAASRRLSQKIDRTLADIEALRAVPATFTRRAPEWWTPRVARRYPPAAGREGDGATGRGPRRNSGGAGKGDSTMEAEAAKAVEMRPTDSAPNTPESPNPSAPTNAADAPAAETPPPAPDAAAAPPATDAPVVAPDAAKPADLSPSPVSPAPRPAVAPPPGAPTWTRDQWLRYRQGELDQLLAKRRGADERYDPAKAIAAQTRYLVRLARRYGSVDWALQAYHGGEGGVSRTVAYYLGDRRAQFTSTEGAIRGVYASRGGSSGRRSGLTYTDLYFGITPRTHPQAFGYLFGRSDDHRYYWWKVLMAERAIDLYRRDKGEFERQWRALRPGQRMEAAWYPDPEERSFRDVAALKRGYAEGELARMPADLGARGIELGPVAPLDPTNAYHYKGLRRESLGALLRLAALYRRHGGRAPLRLLTLAQTRQYAALLDARYPKPPPKEPVDPADVPIDLHPTGLTFDIQRPATAWDRKVLEYALGQLADRHEIYWLIERERGPSRYHVTPNPARAESLAGGVPQRINSRATKGTKSAFAD